MCADLAKGFRGHKWLCHQLLLRSVHKLRNNSHHKSLQVRLTCLLESTNTKTPIQQTMSHDVRQGTRYTSLAAHMLSALHGICGHNCFIGPAQGLERHPLQFGQQHSAQHAVLNRCLLSSPQGLYKPCKGIYPYPWVLSLLQHTLSGPGAL